MYGYVSDSNNAVTDEIILDKYEEFEQLRAKYPEHEIYLFLGTDVDMALFFAPGVSAMLIESRASPDKIF
ncbi:MAG: hypothetical protein WBC05_12715 [Sedimentisphaerales bacterium]